MKLVPRFRKQRFAYLTVLCLALAAAVSFGVPAKAAENPQTSVSNTGKEADATKNQTSKAEQVSAPYEGTGKTSKSLYGGQTELEKNIQTLQPSSIIGTDERTRISSTTSFPYRATVQLSIKYPNTSSTYGCTGFLINPNTVVTAGHCVYSQDHGWASTITAAPGRNGSSYPYGTYSGTMFYSVKGWTESKDTNYDYGAIKLNGSPGNTVGWYGYRTTNSSSPVGLSSSVTGFPCDKTFGTMWSDTKPIRSAETYKLTYTTDTYGCQSGSPVYRNYSDTGQTAIAIHTNGGSSYNLGTRVTNDVFNNIQYWANQ
ncbi:MULTISPECIES: extracellular metalloprotease Mpr [Bacillus]|uniref:extracellular metalloprotease Mpr n=1 Tax=Bacillus TaxID=1386 RepID=UPI00059E1934|nr:MULTISPECIES: extracellular metalloprotease Mpr [Bacillus]KIN40054.1 Glutamyl endopeptidase precursor, blaSE [Bacillus subtilis]MBO3765234.1 extracellular metalloprotease Mpr [Bacillus subtilis]MCB4339019.1 Extracellular metalloprotease [Bacillus subtilis]MCG3230728.1 trypsin-like serine protease [Bacillus subtilis]MDH3120533.1 extracellular metalloprotease Mpr [Bacillus subtilis]